MKQITKQKDGKTYTLVYSCKPGEEYSVKYKDGTIMKRKIEVFNNLKPGK